MQAAAIAAIGAALVLGGCGRKGPLDPPPTASAVPQATTQPEEPPRLGMSPLDADETPTARPGQRRRLPIDVLID